ncbi:hypothetical protein ACQKOH_09180 [Sphingomonas sp. NPDC092331]|jgi:hypothetical protein|uniref:hypothetical protein n=1 Tax=unclassified Sphingomonas TaxID=196159 RepID=UPI0024558369|nr:MULTISPECIES: hypothetical protein [unclassified Sphingomonas]MBQ1500967.1 hypothetical protein [Sphingomonas sp.]MDH4743622.1 hypothetical protein [Sphingomonas sp. CBMAI 2297]
MFRWIAGRARCVAGKHERNRSNVRPARNGRFTSRCRYCRVPMLRRQKYDWIALEAWPAD